MHTYFFPSAGIRMHSDDCHPIRVEYQHHKQLRGGGVENPYINIAVHHRHNAVGTTTIAVRPIDSLEDLTGRIWRMPSQSSIVFSSHDREIEPNRVSCLTDVIVCVPVCVLIPPKHTSRITIILSQYTPTSYMHTIIKYWCMKENTHGDCQNGWRFCSIYNW
jgi:hypothetical protein